MAALAAALCFAPFMASAQSVGPVTARDMSLGDPKAKVTVIEYASASCPHCARFNNDVFPAFKAKFIDTGKVHYVFREFLTPPEELALAVFLTARCAGNDKYFAVIDAAFHAQKHIYETGDIQSALGTIATDVGLPKDKLVACVNDENAQRAMESRIQTYAEQDKISSTPTFVINGKRLEGEHTLDTLTTAIADARKSAARP